MRITPVLHGHLAVDAVESEALAEDIAEIKRKPTRQPLQADQAEQLAGAGIELHELALAGVKLHLTAQGRVVKLGRRPVPADLALQGRAAAAYRTAVTQAVQQFADITAVQREIELRAIGIADLPLPVAGQAPVGVEQFDPVQSPDTALVMRLDIETSEATGADGKIVDHDVQRRQFLEDLAGLGIAARLVRPSPFLETRRQLAGSRAVPLETTHRFPRLHRTPPLACRTR